MLKIFIFVTITFTVCFLLLNLIKTKKKHESQKYLVPISLTLIIFGIIFIVLPRFGINPFNLIQTLISKIIPFFTMLRGITIN
jgi:uncharacterized membrane protein